MATTMRRRSPESIARRHARWVTRAEAAADRTTHELDGCSSPHAPGRTGRAPRARAHRRRISRLARASRRANRARR